MANPMFSIIVPVYNTEKYINQCLDSILNQKYKNFELILVDDGSTDGSSKICDEYAVHNDNVHTFHKENGGLSDARNFGIIHSRGEYLLFIDSDDFIAKNSLKSIEKYVSKTNMDVCFLKGYKYYEKNNIQELDEDFFLLQANGKEYIQKYVSQLKKLPASACTKLINRKFALNNNLFFVKGMYSEDVEWFVRLMKCVENFGALNTPYYYYRQNRQGSITNSVTEKNINSMVDIFEIHAKKNENKVEDSYVNNYLAYEYIIMLAEYMNLPKNNQKKVKKNVYDYKWILKYNNNQKVKLAYIVDCLIGIRLTAYLLSLVLNYKCRKV